MQESVWLKCDKPAPMLQFLTHENSPVARYERPREKPLISKRKLLLFACACCLDAGTSVWQVEEYERTGPPKQDGLDDYSEEDFAKQWCWLQNKRDLDVQPRRAAFMRCIAGNPFRRVELPFLFERCTDCGGKKTERYADAAGDMDDRDCQGCHGVGNRCTGCPWLTPTVLSVARTIYDERDFASLGVLADALQDAGCSDASILEHLLGPGPHARGCWVVDLCLRYA